MESISKNYAMSLRGWLGPPMSDDLCVMSSQTVVGTLDKGVFHDNLDRTKHVNEETKAVEISEKY